MVQVSVLNRLGIDEATLRGYASVLFPDASAWDRVDFPAGAKVSYELALALLLANHLIRFAYLDRTTALLLVQHFKGRITRHAREAEKTIEAYRRCPGSEGQMPFVCLEILDGTWARLGDCEELFDIKRYVTAIADKALSGDTYVWSHSVALLPLLLTACFTPEELRGHSDNREEKTADSLG